MIRILDLYIGRIILSTTALSLSVLLVLSGMFRFIDQLRLVGRGDYTVFVAGVFSLCSAPTDLVMFFPMAALIGGLVGLGMLASNSELVVMQAAGMSKLNIVSSVLKTALLMILLVMAVAEWGAPVSERFARELKTKAISGGDLFAARQGVWAKDGESFVNIRQVTDDGGLKNITIYEFSPDLSLQALIYAKSAHFVGGVWQLNDVSRLAFRADAVEQHRWEEQRWRSSLTPDKLGVVSVKPESLSIHGLKDYLDYLDSNQQDSSRYQLAYWRKVTSPLTVIAMLLLALSFIFGPLRSVTMAARVLMGILTGFGFYVANEVFGPVALVYQLPALFGAILPSLLFAGVALYLMQKKV